MQVKIPEDWELPESAVTPEGGYRSRRSIVKALGLAAAFPVLVPGLSQAAVKAPTKLNKKYPPPKGTKPTHFKYVTGYNNFYEFSMDKFEPRILANRGWKTDPWTLEIGGLVEKPLKLDLEQLVKEMALEQRVYRFRCVEAWSMVIPWDGFPLAKLIKKAKPTAKAKYLKFTTFMDKKAAPGFDRYDYYDWPYTEGLRMDEANHELSFLATGLYGRTLPNQNGAPLRLVVPWKYGFKSIKSIVRIDFTEKQPGTLWHDAMPKEYGFYANVNPAVAHLRWTQARERVIGAGALADRIPTLAFNGYEKEVAHLYEGMDLKKHF